MRINIKRVYDPPASDDGVRVLVDRVWPRGKSKDSVKIDRWLKSVAPTTRLRQWFNHEPAKWAEFKKRYFDQLREHKAELRELLDSVDDDTLTLVFGAKDEKHNNAVALREYLNRMRRRH